MKRCSSCKQEKELTEFGKHKGTKDGLNYYCKACANERQRKYYEANPEKVVEKNRKYYEANAEKEAERQRKYYEANPEKVVEKNRKYREANREAVNEYYRNRHQTDPNYRLANNLRRRINGALNGTNKSASTLELLGCTFEEARQHLESQFQPGMTWENHGMHGWHHDHIVPVSAFNLEDEEQQKICFHYTNLQPLWAKDNLSKNRKWDGDYYGKFNVSETQEAEAEEVEGDRSESIETGAPALL